MTHRINCVFETARGAGSGDLRLAFRLERGVAIDLRDLVIEGGLAEGDQ